MGISRLLATGFLGGDWVWLIIIVNLCFVALLILGAWVIIYNAHLTFSAPKRRSRKFVVSVCVASVIVSLLLFAGSFVFAPNSDNYFLRFLAVAVLGLTCIGTTRAWRSRQQRAP